MKTSSLLFFAAIGYVWWNQNTAAPAGIQPAAFYPDPKMVSAMAGGLQSNNESWTIGDALVIALIDAGQTPAADAVARVNAKTVAYHARMGG